MSNQTVKNMELVLLEIRKEVFNDYGDSKAVKTLIHSYQTLIQTFSRLSNDEFDSLNIINELVIHKNTINYLIEVIECEIIQKSMINKDYVAINNYAVALSKMKQIVETIPSVKAGKSIGYVNSIIDELLSLSIKSGTLVTFKDEVHRGMGKTTALIKKAHELGCVLVCATRHQANHAKTQATELGIDVTIINPSESTLIQHKHTMKDKGYLVDELVDKDKLSYLNKEGCKLLGDLLVLHCK